MKAFSRAPVRAEVGDVDKLTEGSVDVDGVELNEVWLGSLGWDFENLEVGLADGWLADPPFVELRK